MAQMRLAVRRLVEFLLRSGSIDSRFTGFDRANEGARIHRRLQKEAGDSYRPEVFLSGERCIGDIAYTVEGRADGIFEGDGTIVIDEIKTTAVPSVEIYEDMNQCHWAQGMVYGALYCQKEGLDSLAVRLTYYQIDEEQIIRFVRQFTAQELENFLINLLEQYTPWARRQLVWAEKRKQSLKTLPFPYSSYRPGQHEMAGEIYRACRTGRDAKHKGGSRIFCQAPTGIGKTMSALFPALRSMGEGRGEKIFYLTARTTARTAAEDAVQLLRQNTPELCLRSITLTAKEKVCLAKNDEGRPACMPEVCPYANGYYDRLRDALAAVLDSDDSYSRDMLERISTQYTVCPYELGLDVSEWCDLIICDYNYLFDPVVRLRRFFETSGDWIFLVDEAHNLPDRARDMYSCAFAKSSLSGAGRALGKRGGKLKGLLTKADRTLLAARRLCEAIRNTQKTAEKDTAVQQLSFTQEADSNPRQERSAHIELPETIFAKDGVLIFKELPSALLQPLHALTAPLQSWLEDNPNDPLHETMLELYFSLHDLLSVADRYDERYVTQLESHGSELIIRLLCLDPSRYIDASLASGRAAALFSATMTPPGFYRAVLGCEDARAIALESPFAKENLGLYSLGISTRYRDRERSVRSVSDALAVLANGHAGNYLAFFPSYAYLALVLDDFNARYPQIRTIAQEAGMDEAGRADFLAKFVKAPSSTLLGFGVMGGVFGEGVDLTGTRLIGCAVVGVGLPQISPRQEMLRRYYEEKDGCGFDYAYRFPGMNKVLQAAGRVIRTESDRGVVVLLDDRFASMDYRRLFPQHWSGLKYLADTQSLEQALNDFWAQDNS